MRNLIRITAAALVCTSLLAAGPASAHERYRGGGGGAGIALAVGALVGLAVGAAVAAPAVIAPAPVAYAPAYAPPPAPVAYAAPQVPPGYCYNGYQGAYVPCAPQAQGYYPAPVSYGY
ncbi:mechanosensitive ion channel protein MscS [Cupriavidus sp. USMAHM13]|uniref:Mechanosensitive ion channel protein MscS n=1 Tax=Cupriavidus malaysiensis TaxID=367825 RepID=A0ABM6FC42_9BURK|nr:MULTISPECIES: mechanosensitive ion channel protein MscS [Cupriavidus]AOZ03428.1 mechanosensitive ion channel protein MscS [Cupriavidus sp. USMAHM13]AOZ09209.1 mechanosensitive ion channel protein MscS [Cupriavidus malaysiensis]